MIYNKNYYGIYDGVGYDNKEHWFPFFEMLADNIVDAFNPKTVLDVGCAWGYLVEALHERGVEAYGIDISDYAISMTKSELRKYFNAQSATENLPESFPKKFDLVTNIEVIEHIPEEECEKVIAQMCRYSDTIVFSSSASDIRDPTHINVQQPEYWAKRFAKKGFFVDTVNPVNYISRDARCYRKMDAASAAEQHEHNVRLLRLSFDDISEQLHKAHLDIAELNNTYAGAAEHLPKVYPDFGNGFEEEKAVVCSTYNASVCYLNEHMIFSEPPVSLRFDPLSGMYCMVYGLTVSTENGIIDTNIGNIGINGRGRGDKLFFSTFDSNIVFENKTNSRDFTISAHIVPFQSPDALKIYTELLDVIDRLDQEISVKERGLDGKNGAINSLQSEKEALTENVQSQEKTEKALRSQIEDKCEPNPFRDSTIDELTAELDSKVAELERYKQNIRVLTVQNNALAQDRDHWLNSYNIISNSQFWKMTYPMRRILDGIKWLLKKNKVTYLFGKGLLSLKRVGFKATWQKVRNRKNSKRALKKAATVAISREVRREQESTVFSRNIMFSIVVPLYNTATDFLEDMIESVRKQTYSRWELCLADGSDSEHSEVGKLVKKIAKKDSRIKYKKLENNLGISENTNVCIEMATGDYIALFDHDDILHPSALFEVMKAICEKDADFIYTDENTFAKKPADAYCPHFKPDFSPDTLRSYNYICHFTVFKRELLKKAGGGFRKEFDGSQDYDIILRLTEQAEHVVHIPRILYFWRAHGQSVASDVAAKPYTLTAAKKALSEHLRRVGLCGEVTDSSIPSTYRIRYELEGEPLISILIPNKDHIDDLKTCVDSILNKSTYKNYEIIVVENNSAELGTFDYYKELETNARVRVVYYEHEFNYSEINNFGAEHCNGEYILLLNNDIEILTENWLEEMLMFAQRKDVGAVGAMLYYPDDTIQHAGVIVGLGGVAGHSHKYFPRGHVGYSNRLTLAQNLSAVTAACAMIPRRVWDEVDGLNELYAVAFNDVDLCMRIRRAGYLIVWSPYVEAYHHESKSRGAEDTPQKIQRFRGEIARFRTDWAAELEAGDPYYNKNLTLDREDFTPR